MKKQLLFLSALVVTVVTFYSCTPDGSLGMFGDAYNMSGGSNPSGGSDDSNGIVGYWISPSCGFSDANSFRFNSNGRGVQASKDCSGICGSIVLNFSYTVSGNNLICVFDASQPLVYCSGYNPQSPNSPGTLTIPFNLNGNTCTISGDVYHRS